MSLKIVTGRTNVAHVTSDDDAAINTGIFGETSCVFSIGEELDYEIISANSIKIKDGDFSFQGKIGRILPSTYEIVSIANGVVGYKRNDIIAVKYQKNESAIESMELCVIQGVATEGIPEDPLIIIGNMREGDAICYFPLYRVKINGLSIDSVEKLFIKTINISTPAPIGSGMDYFGITEPYGWLFCNGQIVNKSDYPQLFNVIGYTYSQNSSGDTFALPDLRERTTVGIDGSSDTFNALGKKTGEKTHTLTINEMPTHTHNIQIAMENSSSQTWRVPRGTENAVDPADVASRSSGSGQAHNNIQPSFVCHKIIRAL